MYTQQEKDKMAMKNSTIDKFAARGDGDGTNRGDRIAARGQKKIDNARSNLTNTLDNSVTKSSNKLERVKNRVGDFPTLRQSEKIDRLKKTNNADIANSKRNSEFEYLNTNYFKGDAGIAAKKVGEETQKGERLVKKGTMLSAKINNRRKG
jgi:hypothetical protein